MGQSVYYEGIMQEPAFELSDKALQEFRELAEEEFQESYTDSEIRDMATNLLTLFNVLVPNEVAVNECLPKLTDKEALALAFINQELKEGRKPSARGVANAAGLRSSRSGLKLLNKFKCRTGV